MLSGFLCKMLVNGILSYFFNTRNDISNHFPSKNTLETLFLITFRVGNSENLLVLGYFVLLPYLKIEKFTLP